MSNDLITDQYSQEQLKLIVSTVAKGATQNELLLFLHRCKVLELDPLKPGQVHFVKYGNNPGTVVVGIDGLRARAQKTNKLRGVKRGVIKDEHGRLIGAWAEVYVAGWEVPIREEVPLYEFNTGRGMWTKMPETMIKKVAEGHALRMAFPDVCGGLYTDDEIDIESEPKVSKSDEIKQKLLGAATPPPVPVESEVIVAETGKEEL